MNILLRITIAYLIVSDFIGAIWPLLNLGPHHPEFEALPLLTKIVSHIREFAIPLLLLLVVLGYLKNNFGLVKWGLVSLVLALVYGGNAFAWGIVGGKPLADIFIYSYLACAVSLVRR